MRKTEDILESFSDDLKKDGYAYIQFFLMVGGTIKTKNDIHHLIMRRIEDRLNNITPSLTRDQKKQYLEKEKNMDKYSNLCSDIWDKFQINNNSIFNVKQENNIFNAIRKNKDALTTSNQIILDFAQQNIKIVNEYYENEKTLPSGIDKLVSLEMKADAISLYSKVSGALLADDNLIPLEEFEPYIKGKTLDAGILSNIHETLLIEEQLISKIQWPKIPQDSESRLKDLHACISELFRFNGVINKIAYSMSRIQDFFDDLDNLQVVLTDTEQQQLGIIRQNFNVIYNRLVDAMNIMELESNEISKIVKRVEKLSVDKIFKDNLQKKINEISVSCPHMNNLSTNMDELLLKYKNELEKNIPLFDKIMKASLNKSGKLFDVRNMIKSLEITFNNLSRRIAMLCERQKDFIFDESKNQLEFFIQEFGKIQIKFDDMIKTLHITYDKYLIDDYHMSNLLLECKGFLENRKLFLEISRKAFNRSWCFHDEQKLSKFIENIELIFSPFRDGSYKELVKINDFSPSIDEISLMQQCDNLVKSIREIANSIIEYINHQENYKLINKKSNFDKFNKNNHRIMKAVLPDNYFLIKIKKELEELIDVYKNKKIPVMELLKDFTKLENIIANKTFTSYLLFGIEREQLKDCHKLIYFITGEMEKLLSDINTNTEEH